MNISKILAAICLSLLSAFILEAKENKNPKESRKANSAAARILVVGLDNNVKSNYFYMGMIAEETGINAEHIDREYNRIIAENIAVYNKTSQCEFIPVEPEEVKGDCIRPIPLNGDEENCNSDLSSIPADEWKNILTHAEADYMLVLNQHYLKWQETPLRTLFHIVSYTLFDKDKKEIYRGNNYFTTMSLEKPDELRKISRKSSSKIAANVVKSLDDK